MVWNIGSRSNFIQKGNVKIKLVNLIKTKEGCNKIKNFNPLKFFKENILKFTLQWVKM